MDLVSQGALRVAQVVWRPGHGGFAFTVVCKATFELQPDLSPLAAAQEPVALADVYLGEGGGLVLASDLVPVKMRPEVLLTGHAYAPEGQPAASVLARLAVGEIDKTIQVVGDRHFGRDGRLSEPEYFTRMPLGWERAAVGPDSFNPAGRPLGVAAQPDLLGRVLAPNLLLPGLRIRSRSDLVPAVGFGPIAPLWSARSACLHQHAAAWDPSRWHEQPLPADLDLGYFNAAPRDQQRTLPFGEEAIYLENLHARFAQLSTRLAPVAPAATVDHGSGPQPLQLRCDTLLLDTDRGLVMLVWRAHVLLDRPDRPGRVVVTGPAAPRAAIPARAANVSDADVTIVPSRLMRSAAVLPFSDAAAQAPRFAPPPPPASAPEPPSDEDEGDMTLAPGFNLSAAVLPFAFARGASVPPREAMSAESASALPFIRPSADEEEGDGPATPRRPDLAEPMSLQAASAPLAASWASAVPAPLPLPAPVSPWGMPTGSLAMGRALESAPAPAPASDTPVPPPLIGPIAIISEEVTRAQDSNPPVAEEAAEPEVEIAFDVYPPSRCGGIAARLSRAGGEEDKVGEILRGEDLDAGRWQRVHAYWLERIREEAARSRKTLLSEYDGAYVGALESERGAIVLEAYARLAEAAERGEVAAALAEGGLPEGAWAHIHRVWIGRMVKDVRLGKQVRGAIEARRAAG